MIKPLKLDRSRTCVCEKVKLIGFCPFGGDNIHSGHQKRGIKFWFLPKIKIYDLKIEMIYPKSVIFRGLTFPLMDFYGDFRNSRVKKH